RSIVFVSQETADDTNYPNRHYSLASQSPRLGVVREHKTATPRRRPRGFLFAEFQMAEQETQLEVAPGEARSPLVELLYLAMPTVAQMASYTLMQFINTWQLSRLGTDEPTATGNAGIISFAIMCFGVGVLFLVNTLVSQHYGRREYRACGKFLWQGIW